MPWPRMIVALALAFTPIRADSEDSATMLQRDAALQALYNSKTITEVHSYDFGASGEGGVAGLNAWAEHIDRVQKFSRRDASPAIPFIASLVPAAQRAVVAGKAKSYLRDYQTYVGGQGYPTNYVSTAILFATLAAYSEVRGKSLSDEAYLPKVWFGLGANMAKSSPVRLWDDEKKQQYADFSAIIGIACILDSESARKKHDSAALKLIHDNARFYVRSVWNVDLDTTSPDDLICMTDVSRNSSCERYKWIVTGGRAGQPFDEIERAIRANLARKDP